MDLADPMREAEARAGGLGALLSGVDPSVARILERALEGREVSVDEGELLIRNNVAISGAGNPTTLDAQGQSRIFHIQSGFTVTLASLALTRGAATQGGAIFNAGTLTLSGSAVERNSATFAGGGINNANFSTPANYGGTPRMQMFLWPGNQFGSQNVVTVGESTFSASWARFGPPAKKRFWGCSPRPLPTGSRSDSATPPLKRPARTSPGWSSRYVVTSPTARTKEKSEPVAAEPYSASRCRR